MMTLPVRRLTFAFTALLALLSVNQTLGAMVAWDVDSAQSFVRLAIPDQTVILDGTSVMVRMRGANNAAWSDNNGARAALDGIISSDLQSGSIQFIGGAHSLVALEAGAYRPNPSQWNPSAATPDSPDGQYSGTSGASAAFGGKLRSSLVSINPDLAYLAFRNVAFDLDSGVVPLLPNAGNYQFAGNTNQFGIESAAVDIDGLELPIIGQAVPDTLNAPLANVIGANSLGGGIQLFTLLGTELTLNITVPITITIGGAPLQAMLSGQIKAYAIPEPSSVLLAGFALCGLCWAGHRRLRCG